MVNIRISVADWIVDEINIIIEQRHTQKSVVYEELILKGMIAEGIISREKICAGPVKPVEAST
jgi:hypothetical protein